MLSGSEVRGVIPALVTPFTKNDQVDLKGVETITKFLIENGVHALMPVGGTGEFPSLLQGGKTGRCRGGCARSQREGPHHPGDGRLQHPGGHPSEQ